MVKIFSKIKHKNKNRKADSLRVCNSDVAEYGRFLSRRGQVIVNEYIRRMSSYPKRAEGRLFLRLIVSGLSATVIFLVKSKTLR